MVQNDFITFLRTALDRLDMPVLQLEHATGDKVRNVIYGKQKPPIASMHKWANALHLSDADRLRLYQLADEAHGGDTVLHWIADYITTAEADLAALRRQMLTMQAQLDRIEAATKPPPK